MDGGSKHVPVAVLGGGLTGLSAARHLQRAGVGYRLFERRDEVGGHAVTVEDEGYRFDRTGHLLHLRDAELQREVRALVGDDCHQVERRSRIWSGGVYTRYPFQANTHGLPPRAAYECVLGFVKAHFAAPTQPPRDFEQFCLQTFGEGISRHFMLPYNSRMWGVPPREITSAWCQRFVPTPSLEDVLAGAVGLADRELGYNRTFLYPRLGIGELPRAMHRELGHVELGRAPTRIDFANRRLQFADGDIGYDALISTAPLPTLISLLDHPPAPVREAASALRCTHLYYLDVALAAPCRQDLHWVYVPEEKYPFYRVGCYSNFSSAMAPPGKANLYVELVDRTEPDVPSLLPRVAQALVEMELISTASDIVFARLRKLDQAYVIFDHHHDRALGTILPFLAERRILSTGRYGGWNYSAMEDALVFGRDAARQAQELLT